MPYPFLQRYLQVVPVVLVVIGSVVMEGFGTPANARPAEVFIPYLQEIQSNIPVGVAMRLPSQILITDPLDMDINQLIVRVFPSDTPAGVTVSLFTCHSGPQPCLVGSFSAQRKSFSSAMRELAQHQAKGDPITLRKDVRGYLLEGPNQNPSYEFSSVMWEQDGMVYRVTFPNIERQNILLMAGFMANSTPLRRMVPRPAVLPRY